MIYKLQPGKGRKAWAALQTLRFSLNVVKNYTCFRLETFLSETRGSTSTAPNELDGFSSASPETRDFLMQTLEMSKRKPHRQK